MNPLQNAILGILFWLLALFQVIVMAWMWKYNDASKHTSGPHEDQSDPWQTFLRKWILIHRGAGILYVLIYVALMTQMLPRMWTYQVELPARTVIHLMLGLSIGIVLISKIAIIRFFQHLAHLLPTFGFVLFFFTTLLLAVSIPSAYQEQRMITSTRAFSDENIARIERLLPKAGYSVEDSHDLANLETLKAGREVLLQKCVQCHDLRTILTKPRTPKGWGDLVERMASKPIIGLPMSFDEVDWATVYLIGITPDLQSSAKRKRETEGGETSLRANVNPIDSTPFVLDMASAASLSTEICTQCHEMDELDEHGGDSEEGWRNTVNRMQEENELYEDREVLEQIIKFLAISRPL
ncbi:MAG: hypothetical protein HQ507_03840 [Candidatus Marinimicrobia bacterium]|nr:hypothetical protein [Candidatus Neomarinimicrobiota bacterium]